MTAARKVPICPAVGHSGRQFGTSGVRVGEIGVKVPLGGRVVMSLGPGLGAGTPVIYEGTSVLSSLLGPGEGIGEGAGTPVIQLPVGRIDVS